jgi:predicted transcriptional regulator
MSEIDLRNRDDHSYDEVLRELAYAGMVGRGLEDSEQGRTVSNEEVRRKIDSWFQ